MNAQIIKIAIASDLHLMPFSSEYRKNFLNYDQPPNILVLAGDVAGGTSTSIMVIREIAERYPEPHIIVVAGNHEHYHTNSLNRSVQEFRDAFKNSEKIHFLEDDRLELIGLTFLGCTLWTDFSILGEPELAMHEASKCIADFRFIHTRPDTKFTPADAARIFMQSYEFLDQNMASSDPAKTVVISHFPPGMRTQNTNFEESLLTGYFQANVDNLIASYQPALWLYGHNHESADFFLGSTRVVSNQLGYTSEPDLITKFDRTKTLEIEID